MSKFKINQRVECIVQGKGVVQNIFENREYCVLVSFDNGQAGFFTKDGRMTTTGNITLTTGTWDVKEVLPEPVYNEGDLVWVRDTEVSPWTVAYFSKKIKTGVYNFEITYPDGKVSNWVFCKPFDGTDPYKDKK